MMNKHGKKLLNDFKEKQKKIKLLDKSGFKHFHNETGTLFVVDPIDETKSYQVPENIDDFLDLQVFLLKKIAKRLSDKLNLKK